jgi:uncharacterized membrane protein
MGGLAHNPSSWPHRLLVITLAGLGFSVAAYLTLEQLGVLHDVWEPFFGKGSEKVLHSAISRALPVPDAALGAAAYGVDFCGGLIGGRSRFRTMPRFVVTYGCAVVLFAAVALTLAVLQPVVVRAYCTLCLVSAAISIGLVPLVMPELRASARNLRGRAT